MTSNSFTSGNKIQIALAARNARNAANTIPPFSAYNQKAAFDNKIQTALAARQRRMESSRQNTLTGMQSGLQPEAEIIENTYQPSYVGGGGTAGGGSGRGGSGAIPYSGDAQPSYVGGGGWSGGGGGRRDGGENTEAVQPPEEPLKETQSKGQSTEILNKWLTGDKNYSALTPEAIQSLAAQQWAERQAEAKKAAEPNKPVNWGEVALGTLETGLGGVNQGATTFLDWLLGGLAQELWVMGGETINAVAGKQVVGETKNPITALNDWVHETNQRETEYYTNLVEGNRVAEAVYKYGSNVVAAIPTLILAWLTKGASLAAPATTAGLETASAIAQAPNGIQQVAMMTENALARFAQDPTAQATFVQAAGNSYDEAIADGATEEEASVYAVINGSFNTMVELGGLDEALGGMQNLPKQVQEALAKGNKNVLWQWILSILSEVGEEWIQGMGERGLKGIYTDDVPLYSKENPNAIINPEQMKEEGIGAAITSAILGGGQAITQMTVNAMNNPNLPQWGELTKQQQEAISRVVEKATGKLSGKKRNELLQMFSEPDLPEYIYNDYTHGQKGFAPWSEWFGDTSGLASRFESLFKTSDAGTPGNALQDTNRNGIISDTDPQNENSLDTPNPEENSGNEFNEIFGEENSGITDVAFYKEYDAAKMANWLYPDGSIWWPANRGYAEKPKTIVLQPGTIVDRYGYDSGCFVSPEGTPYTQRALAPGSENKPYVVFEVLRPIEVQSGIIAPWFMEEGGGIQYEFSEPISVLIEHGILKKVGQ